MEFLLIMFIFPAIVLILSIVGYLITKRSYVTPAIIFVLFSFLLLLFFNESFFIWVIVYSVLSVIISVIMSLFNKKEQK
jgi:Protein of unknown function (DUF2651)